MNVKLEGPRLGKCKARGCKVAVHAVEAFWAETGPEASEPGLAYRIGNYGFYARCPEHGLFQLRPIRGRYSPEHKCDARCTTATGPSCDCSCGGANHGTGHAVAA